jgi:hypothetical protein
MNSIHIHLLTNHLPILGTAFGLLVLLLAALFRAPSQQVRNCAYILLVVSALGAIVANWSGEGAEELTEKLPGFSHDAIEAHEEAAPFALGGSLLAGALAVAALVMSVLRPAWNVRMAVIVGLAAVLAFAASVRTGLLGGKIRHTELDQPKSPDQPH